MIIATSFAVLMTAVLLSNAFAAEDDVLGKILDDLDFIRLRLQGIEFPADMLVSAQPPDAAATIEITKKPSDLRTSNKAQMVKQLRDRLRMKSMFSMTPLQIKRGMEPKRNLLPTIDRSQASKFRCYFSPIHC